MREQSSLEPAVAMSSLTKAPSYDSRTEDDDITAYAACMRGATGQERAQGRSHVMLMQRLPLTTLQAHILHRRRRERLRSVRGIAVRLLRRVLRRRLCYMYIEVLRRLLV